MKPVKLGPFKGGINNVAPDHSLPADPSRKVYYLRDAVNVDITNSGTIRRRAGYAKALAGAEITSAWSDGTSGYVVDAGELKRVTPDADGFLLSATIENNAGADLSRGAAFVKTPLGLLVSDGHQIYSVVSDELMRFTHDAPGYIASATSGEGNVLVTATLLDGDMESAVGVVTRLSGTYPITVTVAAAQVGRVMLYLSTLNGTELYRHGVLKSVTTVIPAEDGLKDSLKTQNMVSMVAGSRMYFAFGRLWSLQNGVVFYSDPYYLHLRQPTNFVQFPDTALVFHPTNYGFVVATSQELGFIQGTSPEDFVYRQIAPYGAVPGTDVVDVDNGVFLMTARGLVKVSQDGALSNLHEGKVAVDQATHGAAGIIERDGAVNVVTSLMRPELSRTAATSFMDAEIIRKETVL